MKDCVRKVLANVEPTRIPKENKLVWEWAFRPGDYARVVVRESNGNIISAYTRGSGKKSARWADCVKGKV